MFNIKKVKSSITPFEEFAFDSFFNGFDDLFHSVSTQALKEHSFPKVNISDESDYYLIEAELAGWNKEDIQIKVQNGGLILTGTTSTKAENSDKKFLIRELKRSKFQRSFLLGENLNHENISAEFNNGLLRITVPKAASQNTPKVVTIK